MYEYREHAPHKLSGGQKQGLPCRYHCNGTFHHCLDEPTAMLDLGVARSYGYHKTEQEKGITIVLITMDEAIAANRVVVMDKGNILMDGTPKEIFLR
ncbi:MAG: hypothetical protein ACLSCV_02715 [Acutalibacteraceae bacterium]